MLSLLVLLAACKRVPSDDMNQRTITLRGRIPQTDTASVPGAIIAALGPADAVKVIMISGNQYEIRAVSNGAFSFPVPTDRVVSLVLVGPADEYLGFVSVRDAIPGVPVQAVDDGVSTIDLGTLVASGALIAPGVDPVGNGITLDDAEIEALSELGVVARAFLEDPDVDGDGVIDLLQGREFRLQIAALRNSSFAGLVGQPAAPVSVWQMGVNVVEDGVDTYPSSATVTGPAGSGIDALMVNSMAAGFGNILYGIPLPTPEVRPTPGMWTLTYGERTLLFQLADVSGLADIAPALEPTVVLHDDQTIERIDWVWRMADGSTSTAPASLASDVRVQVVAGAPAVRCPESNLTQFAPDNVYAMVLPPETVSHELACQDIPWSAVSSVELSYVDVFGSQHVFVAQRF
ncbi:MAG: hypothetical protein IPH72_16175 [Sandaracinaceae bacterium]|nr:hypothetical protein [Sandaracinaceae bacterium]MBP7682418.1 hypothetical protein [Deltaproteobacteria bacterium]